MHGVAILKCAEVQEQRPTMCSVQQQSVVLLKQVGLLLMTMIAKQGPAMQIIMRYRGDAKVD